MPPHRKHFNERYVSDSTPLMYLYGDCARQLERTRSGVKSLYPASISHHRPRSAVYRANTVTRPSRMSKAVKFTLGPCILLQTCARACDCSGCWGRRMREEMSCPGTAPGLDVAGMWNSITPRGRLRSPSSANGSAMSTWKAMASRRTTPRRAHSVRPQDQSPRCQPAAHTTGVRKRALGRRPPHPPAVPGDILEDSPEPHQQVGEGG